MVQAVVGQDGKEVRVLEQGDLDAAKNSLIRWLVFTVIPVAFVLGLYATRLDARNEQQDAVMVRNLERITVNEQEIRANRRLREQLDSLLIETRHLTDEVRSMNQFIKRTNR